MRGYRQPRELSEDTAAPTSLLLHSKSAFAWISAMGQLRKRPKGWSGSASGGARGGGAFLEEPSQAQEKLLVPGAKRESRC